MGMAPVWRGPRGKLPPKPEVLSREAPRSEPTHRLLIVANFVEVWLAKEGTGLYRVNYLEKSPAPRSRDLRSHAPVWTTC